MRITIVGTGYVGLVTGVCLSDKGNTVHCIDNNVQKVKRLQNGEVPIYEPGLDVILQRNYKNGNLHFSTDISQTIKDSQIVFLALPTPPKPDGSADLSYIFSVVRDLAQLIDKYTVIVVKSTVPVGTGDKVENYLSKFLDKSLFDVVSNPEFLKEGAAIDDFMDPDRIIVGTDSPRAGEIMKELYEPYVHADNSLLIMDRRSSELSKYASNCFLATKISFMNEMATLCDKLGANVDNIKRGIGTDSRISDKFLNSGIGYGGSCFPKDVKALISTAKGAFYTPKLLVASEQVNREQKGLLVRILDRHFEGNAKNKTIGIWGGAFKPNTDDIREAPALEIIKSLLLRGAHVKLYDPEAMENILSEFGDDITYCRNKNEVLNDADALLVTTEWAEFKDPDLADIKKRMRFPLIVDGRNMYNPEDVRAEGFTYYSVGRPESAGTILEEHTSHVSALVY